MEKKKYYGIRYRDEYEDYVSVGLTPANEEEYLELVKQDGENWYGRKDEFYFFLTNNIDDLVAFLEEYSYVKDGSEVNLPEEEKQYVLDKLNGDKNETLDR